MRIYSNKNVFEAGLDRIRWLFDEFEEVVVGFSGGKDSTVVLNLCLIVAKEKNRLPLKVMFLDQEAEWENVINYQREIMNRPDVNPLWFQMPIKIFNATSEKEPWLMCWEEGKEWIREKEKISIKENKYGTDRFHDLFGAILRVDFVGKKTCYIAGVRAEESPARYTMLTSTAKYKHITYGKKFRENKGEEHYTFYPLYDWSYTDIWKAIHDNNWSYCKIYDYFYMYGISPKKMRVSNVHHETAVHSLYYLQEIEKDTWEKLTKRLSGISSVSHLGKEDFFVKDLPFMFKDWKEYRDYLLENLIESEEKRKIFIKKFNDLDNHYKELPLKDGLYKMQINTLLINDFEFTKLDNWERNPELHGWRNYMKGKQHKNNKTNKYIIAYEKNKGRN